MRLLQVFFNQMMFVSTLKSFKKNDFNTIFYGFQFFFSPVKPPVRDSRSGVPLPRTPLLSSAKRQYALLLYQTIRERYDHPVSDIEILIAVF
jgi:hypothetical protein